MTPDLSGWIRTARTKHAGNLSPDSLRQVDVFRSVHETETAGILLASALVYEGVADSDDEAQIRSLLECDAFEPFFSSGLLAELDRRSAVASREDRATAGGSGS